MEGGDIVINIVGRPLTKRSIKVCFQKLYHTFITKQPSIYIVLPHLAL